MDRNQEERLCGYAFFMAHICKALATCYCVFRGSLHMVIITQPILQQGSKDSKK